MSAVGSPTSAGCERCGNTRPGAGYGFRYGTVSETSEVVRYVQNGKLLRVTTTYRFGEPAFGFICDECVGGRRRVLRRMASIAPVVACLIFGAILIEGGIADHHTGALIGGVAAIAIGPIFRLVTVKGMETNFTAQVVGEQFAIAARRKDLRKQGHTHFWATKEFAELVKSSTPAVE